MALGRPTPLVVGRPEITGPDPRQFSWADGFTAVKPIETPAVDFIADQLRRHPNQITLISVGPVSNLADLLQTDPEVLQLAKQVYSMFGSFYLGYGGSPVPSAEWNVRADIPSARTLSSSKVSDHLRRPGRNGLCRVEGRATPRPLVARLPAHRRA